MVKGLWFFPQFPDHQVAGVLSFDPSSGATLDLIGDSFSEELFELYGSNDESTGMKSLPIPLNRNLGTIIGWTEKGDPITLFDCQHFGDTWSTGYIGSRFRANYVLQGCHFGDDEEITFDSITIRFEALEQWLGITGFMRRSLGEEFGIEFKYNAPDTKFVAVGNKQISFSHDLSYQTGGMSASSEILSFVKIKNPFENHILIAMTYEINLFIYQCRRGGSETLPYKIRILRHYLSYKTIFQTASKSSNPVYYKEYLQIVHHIRQFLTLGIGKALKIISIEGENNECKYNDSETLRTITVYYPSNFDLPDLDTRPSRHQLFRYSDVEDNLEKYLNTWFDKREELKPLFDLYFGLVYNSNIYLHLQLLTLTQALEAYHRRMYGGQYVSEEEYQAISKSMKEAIPGNVENDFRQKLKTSLKYQNEYSLIKRLKLILKEVLSPYSEIVEGLVGNVDQFSSQVKDTRNYLTHYSQELEDESITNYQNQIQLTQKLKILVQLCLLRELEMPPKIVVKRFQNQ